MALLEWKEEYKTGFPAVDYEHENLISRVNELSDRINADADADEIRDHLAEIDALIEAHFALEEKLMRDIRYEGYVPHKADHDHLLEQIRDIMEDVEDDPSGDVRSALQDRMKAWFGNHFATEDKKLHTITEGRHH